MEFKQGNPDQTVFGLNLHRVLQFYNGTPPRSHPVTTATSLSCPLKSGLNKISHFLF